MQTPLVSVICLNYNQKAFLEEAVASVMSQTYEHVELIIVDDASTDGSSELIHEIATSFPQIHVAINSENLGNCCAFNKGLTLAKGDFIIDLAADDVLFPERVTKGVKRFLECGDRYGVNFTDVALIDQSGKFLRTHYKRNKNGALTQPVPEGDLYRNLLARYLVSTPSMMIRRSVLEELGGYDEHLTYEDFDFWVRSSRNHWYCFIDEVLVKKRMLTNSLSKQQYQPQSPYMESTYEVCLKALALNQNRGDELALIQRAGYELRQCLKWRNLDLAGRYLEMMQALRASYGQIAVYRLAFLLRQIFK